jgi:glucan phosphorylase
MRTGKSEFNNNPSTGKEQTQEMVGKVTGEVREQAKQTLDKAQDQAMSMVSSRKEEAASQLDSIAHAFRETSTHLRNQNNDQIARYTENLADQVERVAGYIHNGDVNQFLSDAEDLARRQPELFLGGAFTLGLLAARFFKSSAPRRSSYRGMDSGYGRYSGWQGSGYSSWDREQRWGDERFSGQRSQQGNYGSAGSRYGDVDRYPDADAYTSGQSGQFSTGGQLSSTVSTPESATVGRTAGMTAGTTAGQTTQGGQTESRRTFDKNDKDASEKESK